MINVKNLESGCRGGDTCCRSWKRCAIGEGDCDSDSECQPGLRCGKDNCRSWPGNWDSEDDCCYK